MAEALIDGGGSPTALAGLGRLAPWRQLALLVGLAGAVALGVSVAMWSQKPGYALLYGSLGGQDSGEVVAALEQAGIPIRLDEQSGALLVPAEKVHEARMRLATLGLPRSTERGFEVLDAEQSFGTSQFVERARFQRALEVELGRTISNLDNVQSARVHLAVPRETAFLRNRQPPSASVLVQLHAGRNLAEGQAEAIAHLVSAAIPNLEPTQVRVVNERGRLLNKPSDDEAMGASSEQLDYSRRVEKLFAERIENILGPVLGVDSVRAEVTADLDFTRVEQSSETFNPDLPATRSEQLLVESGPGAGGLGVPGALTNQPPAAVTVPEELAGTGDAALAAEAGNATRRNRVINYELDRVISHTRQRGASLRRLSVAVVVDDVRSYAEDGTPLTRSRTPEEMSRLTALVREAVGYDATRGDTVNVINAAFAMPHLPGALPEQPIWEQPWVWTVARQAGGALLVLVLGFGVLRPFMRNLVARDAAEREALAATERARLGDESSTVLDDEVNIHSSRDARRGGGGADMDNVRRLVQQDPKRVANTLKDWVSDNG